MATDPQASPRERPRFVLLTQCMQNDLFLNRQSRLLLPDHIVRTMLLGKRNLDLELGSGSRRTIDAEALADGPLGRFLEMTVGRRMRSENGSAPLHVINIRDWHEPGGSYDAERRRYGAHCEAGSWGAEYIDGLENYFDPGGSPEDEQARYFEAGDVRIYHVHSDSMFDFKPRADVAAGQRKFRAAQLEDVLDVLVQGTDADLERMREILRRDPRIEAVHELARELDDGADTGEGARCYVCVIGAYTDIKVKTLLTGLRTRYNLENLAVSDTLTASATLERHLAGLDFAAKVLSVEVVHGINDLVRLLGGTGDLDDEEEVVAGDSFSRYQSFFQDQQNVLAYQSERLQDYLLLTERRAVEVYNTINRSNRFLIWWGGTFLLLTLVLSVLAVIWPDRIDWKLPAITGGLSLAQFVGAFFSTPVRDLQKNLTNLAVFKMILESHSLKTAFTRFHLTTPQTLRELATPDEAAAAARQIDALRAQLEVIQSFDKADFDGLERLGFGTEQAEATSAPAELAPFSGGQSQDGEPRA